MRCDPRASRRAGFALCLASGAHSPLAKARGAEGNAPLRSTVSPRGVAPRSPLAPARGAGGARRKRPPWPRRFPGVKGCQTRLCLGVNPSQGGRGGRRPRPPAPHRSRSVEGDPSALPPRPDGAFTRARSFPRMLPASRQKRTEKTFAHAPGALHAEHGGILCRNSGDFEPEQRGCWRGPRPFPPVQSHFWPPRGPPWRVRSSRSVREGPRSARETIRNARKAPRSARKTRGRVLAPPGASVRASRACPEPPTSTASPGTSGVRATREMAGEEGG